MGEAESSRSIETRILLDYRNFYGRRQGKKLSGRLQKSLDENLPKIYLALEDEQVLDPAAVFDAKVSSYALEIGFGLGDNLLNQAIRMPNRGYIGVDLFMNGLAKIAAEAEEKLLTNIRLIGRDGRAVLEAMKPASLSQIFILFADPWPKRRHFKRRIITSELIERAAQKLTPGGELILASDHPDYKVWIAKQIENQQALELEKVYDTAIERPDFIEVTKYESRGLQLGDTALYFRLKKA